MIYHLFYPLIKYFSPFNVTRYITFRGGCSFITSFLIVFILWKFTINKLKKLKLLERIDMYGHVHLESLHGSKKGTPTMGGILINFSIILTTLLWARLDNCFIWMAILIIIALGALGFADDYLKTKTGKGLSRLRKLNYQILTGLVIGVIAVLNKNSSTVLDLPFMKSVFLDLGYFYIFWVALIIVATSNAVNFTDGLDGLAIGALIINALLFAFLAYLSGHATFANYLFIPHVKDAGELTVLCLAVVGAGLGFLWFNSHPAEVFMGDVGALALGGLIGAVALFIKKEFLLVVSGGLFVAEALSVILQMLSVRLVKKKFFLAAPFHHHLQILGWKESKITVRLWIVSIICAVVSLLTLKLR